MSFPSETTPTASATPPKAPPGTRLYAVGDIHGRDDLLVRILDSIAEDATQAIPGERLVVFLGDLIDRGPTSRDVVERLRMGPPPTPQWAGFRWIVLRGNHEQMLLNFLDDASAGPNYLYNGGTTTILSYAGPHYAGPGGLASDDLARIQESIRRAIPPEHQDFLRGLPLFHVAGDYLFVHAGMRPGIPLQRQTLKDLTTIRGEFLRSDEDFGRMVVHGHSISLEPEDRPNRIGIDTGAFHTNRLTALVAEGDWHGFLRT